MPARPRSTGCWPEVRAARSSCASRTPISSGPRASQSRRSSRTCAGWASTGPRVSTPAAITVRIDRPSGCTCIAPTPWSCCRRAPPITASVPPNSSRPIARPRSLPDVRRSTSAVAASISRDEARRRIDERREGGHPLSRARGQSRHRLQRSRSRRGALQHRGHRRSGPRALRRCSRVQLRRRHRRCADGDHACDPRRGSHLEYAATAAAVRGVRMAAAGRLRTCRW